MIAPLPGLSASVTPAIETLSSWPSVGVSSGALVAASRIVSDPTGSEFEPAMVIDASENCSRSMLRSLSVPSVPMTSLTVTEPSSLKRML